MSETQTLGDRLRAARSARGLTKTSLARQAGLSHSHIVRLEKNAARASRFVLEELARVLDVRRAWLETGEGQMRRTTPEPAEIGVAERDSWQTTLTPALSGSPLETVVDRVTPARREALATAWWRLAEERRREIRDTVRRMATVARLIEDLLPGDMAETLNAHLASQVVNYVEKIGAPATARPGRPRG